MNYVFFTRSNGYDVTIDNTSSKYLSVDYDCWRIADNESGWWYKLYLANGTTKTDSGSFNHSDADPDPKCYLTTI